MKRLLLIALTVVLAASLFAAEDSVALISASKGKVDLRRATKVVPHKTGDFLLNKDEIKTGGESFAAYKYIDGSSTVKVFANSVVRVIASTQNKKLAKKVELDKGSIYTQIKSNTGPFSVETPTTVASVKGTAFLTEFDEYGQSTFIVTEGELALTILEQKETQSVKAGNTAIIQADGSYEINPSTKDDILKIEQAEIASKQEQENKKMSIPVVGPDGQTKYIEITW